MNLTLVMKTAERAQEFIEYMNMFYSLEHDGIYAEDMQFTHEEIVDGINEYFKGEMNLKNVLEHGADTVDRELVRDIILKMRGEV